MRVYLLGILLILSYAFTAISHGGKKHNKDSVAAQADSVKLEYAQGDIVHHHDEGMKVDESKVTADFDDFPSLHPLIVHFAISLIIVAAAIQLLNVFLLKKEIAWIIGGLLLMGFLAAWFASKDFHPHTHGLSAHAKLVLEQHDKWAAWTIYTATAGLLSQIVYLFSISYKNNVESTTVHGIAGFPYNIKRTLAIVIAVIMLSSAYCVARAGHYGSQLVHIEGIGPQGKFLEMEHGH